MRVRHWRVETHVEHELIKGAACQLGEDVIANGGTLSKAFEWAGALDREGEVVAEIERLSCQQIRGRRGFVPGSRQMMSLVVRARLPNR